MRSVCLDCGHYLDPDYGFWYDALITACPNCLMLWPYDEVFWE